MIHANDNHTGLRFLSVCSGIEAASCAWHPLGWKAVAFSEIEKFPSAVLAHHYPAVPNLGDFTKIDVTTLGRVDILAGGTPCQAFSVAGLRQSLADARGNLSLEYVRLAHELAAHNGLRNAVWENVVGVLSTKDNAFGCFLAGLVGADSPIEPPARGKWPRHGMVSGPKGRAAWAVKDAQFFGVAQRRRRVLVVADFGNGADPAAVLFEPEGVFRHSPPSREAGKGTSADVAPSLVSSGRGVERTGDTRGQDPVVAVIDSPVAYGGNRTSGPLDVATAVNAHGGPHGRLDFESETFVAHIASTLDASFGRLQGAAGQDANHGHSQLVAVGVTGDAVTYSIMPQNSGKDFRAREVDVSQPLMAGGPVGGNQGGDYVLTSSVRRLTPRECERLQGFPDDYTAIPWRGKLAEDCPDGPRYKALGNSWAVPKFAWLGRRISALMPANDNEEIKNAA